MGSWKEKIGREIEAGSFERLHAHNHRLLERGYTFHIVDGGLKACHCVGAALKVAIVEFDHPVVAPLLRAGIRRAEQALSQKAAPAQSAAGAEWQVRERVEADAYCWHAKVLAEAFLANSAPALPGLLQAHENYARLLELTPATFNKDLYLPALHGGAELCLAAGRTELAASLLQVAPPHEPCARRHAVLAGLVASIRAHRGKRAGSDRESPVSSFLRRMRIQALPLDAEDSVALPEAEPARAAFVSFFQLWSPARGGDWIAHPDHLDRVNPTPDQTLATAAHALIEDRFVRGNATPDWRRVLGAIGA